MIDAFSVLQFSKIFELFSKLHAEKSEEGSYPDFNSDAPPGNSLNATPRKDYAVAVLQRGVVAFRQLSLGI